MNAQGNLATIGNDNLVYHGLVNYEKWFAKFSWITRFFKYSNDSAGLIRLNLIEYLHRLNDTKCISDLDLAAYFNKVFRLR